MLTRIKNSIFSKHIAILLAISTLCMSFRMSGDGEVQLNAGTNITLETVSNLSSDRVTVGQIVDFKVKYDVLVDNKVVIPAGSIAKGQVMRSQKAKGLGKEGFMEIQIKSVPAIDGQNVFIGGTNVNMHGDDQQTLAILLGVLVCILFLTIKGKDAFVPKGFETNAYVATSMSIKVAG